MDMTLQKSNTCCQAVVLSLSRTIGPDTTPMCSPSLFALHHVLLSPHVVMSLSLPPHLCPDFSALRDPAVWSMTHPRMHIKEIPHPPAVQATPPHRCGALQQMFPQAFDGFTTRVAGHTLAAECMQEDLECPVECFLPLL